ncbi:hypothetical protein ACWM35_08985 [Neobacillus sp. K501]
MYTSNETFIFSTDVTEATTENEFIVEIFHQLEDTSQGDTPIKVTQTFDEIIDFFEQMDR